MSQQSDEALKSGADGTKAIGKSAGKAGAKLGAKAAKKGAKKVASEAAQAAAAPEAYLAKVFIILAIIVLVIIIYVIVYGTTGPGMSKTEYLTANNEDVWNEPLDEDEEAAIYDKEVAVEQTSALIEIIHEEKAEDREEAIKKMRSKASSLGCDPSLTEEHMTDDTGTDMSGSVSAANIKASENKTKVWKFLKANGYSDEAAAGIMGNMQSESGFDPGIEERTTRKDKGYGLCQWTFGRRTRLESFARSKGKPASNIDVQLDYLLKELKTSYKSCYVPKFRESTDIEYTTWTFLSRFEKPAAMSSQYPIRLNNAKRILKIYKGMSSDGIQTDTDADSDPAANATRRDFDILAAYSVSVGNGELELIDKDESRKSASDDGSYDDTTYTDITGKAIPLYWFGKKAGLPNYQKDLKKKLHNGIIKKHTPFYTISYEMDSSGNYVYGTATVNGREVKYLKATLKERDVTEETKENGKTIKSIAESAFDIDPNEEYANSGNTYKAAIKGISEESYQLLGQGKSSTSEVIATAGGPLTDPLNGKGVVTSNFGYRSSPGGIGSSNHKGIDLGAPSGTPIYAAADGVVTLSGWNGGLGYCLIINHGGGVTTIYGHQRQAPIVKKGQQVKAGQLVGYVGSTGNSTGSHLHFQYEKNGVPLNPRKLIGR